jgi:hypothetical protein
MRCPYFKEAKYPDTYRNGYCNETYWDCNYYYFDYKKCPDYLGFKSEEKGDN